MKKGIVFLASLMIVFFTGCKKDQEIKTTRVEVRMTDAPGDFNAVILNIKEIIIKTDNGQKSILVTEKPFDVLKYRDGNDTLLAVGDIPSGKISQIRLVLNGHGNEVVVDGVHHDLKTPSGQQSGVKLNVHDVLIDGLTYQLLLDFDVAKSIVLTGSGKYILKPVIRTVAKATSGAIKGSIVPVEGSSKVYAIHGADSVGAVSDGSGNFLIHGLAPNYYTVYIEGQNGYKSISMDSVQVVTGQVKDLGSIKVNQ